MIAEEFGYSYRGFTTIVSDFRKFLKTNNEEDFFFKQKKQRKKRTKQIEKKSLQPSKISAEKSIQLEPVNEEFKKALQQVSCVCYQLLKNLKYTIW